MPSRSTKTRSHITKAGKAMRGAAQGTQRKVVRSYRSRPPAPPRPVIPPAPVNPVGMSEGHWNGHDYYQVLPADPRPVGATYSHPVLGWLLKVWIQFPFSMAGGYALWQATDPPQITTAP